MLEVGNAHSGWWHPGLCVKEGSAGWHARDMRDRYHVRARLNKIIEPRGYSLARHERDGAWPALPVDVDPPTADTIRAVREYTMLTYDKLIPVIDAARHIIRHDISGAVVECGVWRGGAMMAIARSLMEMGDSSRDLYLFDTFEGMPPPTSEDRAMDGVSAAQLLARKPRDTEDHVWAYASLPDVQEAMQSTGYPKEKVHFVQGLVEATIPSSAPDSIALLRLDTDWYQSTKHELEHLPALLAPGAVVIFDDYGTWAGARRAVDEWLANCDTPLFLVRTGEARVATWPR